MRSKATHRFPASSRAAHWFRATLVEPDIGRLLPQGVRCVSDDTGIVCRTQSAVSCRTQAYASQLQESTS